jgi:ATP-dependent Lon protease
VASGLLKLLFPNKQFDNNELKMVIDMALEYKQRVRDWLHKIDPGEYPNEKLSEDNWIRSFPYSKLVIIF